MATPYLHPRTHIYWFRRAVPEAIRAKVGKTILTISLKTKDWDEAQVRYLEIALDIQKRWDALKRGVELEQSVQPKRLTHMQRQGLAGEFHRWLITKHEDNPGPAAEWRQQVERDRRIISPPSLKGVRRIGGAVGLYLNQVRAFLDERGIVVDENDLYDLSLAAARAGVEAKETLARHAEGDYSRDRAAERFPAWERVEPTLHVKSKSLIVSRDWDDYVKESGIKPGSRKRYRPILEKLGKFVGTENLALLTPDDIVRWKTHLMSENKSLTTIKNVYFAAGNSIFEWALDNRKVASNPFSEVGVRAPKRTSAEGEAYEEDEARLILSETLRPHRGRETSELTSAKRWIPWLCAYTGARVNEITQMRCKDLRKEKIGDEEVWVLHITPEAGTVKAGGARDVPLHPHLVEAGFPEFVRGKGTGEEPVFYDPRRRRGGKVENPQSHKVGQRLAAWVRDIGAALEAAAAAEHDQDEKERKLRMALRLQDEKVLPNHAWRHRFKSVARDCRMLPDVRDAIQGHAPRTEGERYGKVSLKAKWEEIKLLPPIKVEAPDGPAPKSRRAAREYATRKAAGKAPAGMRTICEVS